jgi:hypothetical protein
MSPSRIKHKKTGSFISCMDMGDQIYSLLFARRIKAKKIYLDSSGGKPYRKENGAIHGHTKFNLKSANFLVPLFNYQNYIDIAEIYVDQEYDFNIGEWDEAVPLHSGTNLLDFHATKFDINWEECTESWLEAPESDKEWLKDIKVVINRTPRYQGNSPFYENILKSFDPSKCLFVGLPQEYEAFVDEFSFPLNFYQADDALDLASVINSVPLFLGNQSTSCAIARGLGKLCFIEIGRGSANYVFPYNKEIHYF